MAAAGLALAAGFAQPVQTDSSPETQNLFAALTAFVRQRPIENLDLKPTPAGAPIHGRFIQDDSETAAALKRAQALGAIVVQVHGQWDQEGYPERTTVLDRSGIAGLRSKGQDAAADELEKSMRRIGAKAAAALAENPESGAASTIKIGGSEARIEAAVVAARRNCLRCHKEATPGKPIGVATVIRVPLKP